MGLSQDLMLGSCASSQVSQWPGLTTTAGGKELGLTTRSFTGPLTTSEGR